MLKKFYETNFIALPIIEYLYQITYNGILLNFFLSTEDIIAICIVKKSITNPNSLTNYDIHFLTLTNYINGITYLMRISCKK